MTSFDRTVLYFFTVYFLGIYQTINCVEITSSFSPLNVSSSTEILKHTTDIHTSVETTSTTVSSSTSSSTTISTTINTSVYSPITSTVTIITSSFLPQAPSGPGWWLFIALVITIIIVIIAGVIFYHRQQSPYRRFLRNWRSHDDDTDNIILQLEQSDINNDQWPSRLAFN